MILRKADVFPLLGHFKLISQDEVSAVAFWKILQLIILYTYSSTLLLETYSIAGKTKLSTKHFHVCMSTVTSTWTAPTAGFKPSGQEPLAFDGALKAVWDGLNVGRKQQRGKHVTLLLVTYNFCDTSKSREWPLVLAAAKVVSRSSYKSTMGQW